MAQFVLCVHVVIWLVFHVPAIGSRSMPLYVWNMILKLPHVPGSCSYKMTPSMRAPSEGNW